MSIIIPHRFQERLLPDHSVPFINTIIIGTFNPGLPLIDLLTSEEKSSFGTIAATKKFKVINEVKNFYDRPRNRFWKIFDLVANADFYLNRPLKTKNPQGLKYYSNMDKDLVFKNQRAFCLRNGIFITDIVREIEPANFNNIYEGFADKGIERAKCKWNTKGIVSAIKKYRPSRVLINFSVNKSIGKISGEIAGIIRRYSRITYCMPSTSGAAGNSYEFLFHRWCPHLNIEVGSSKI